MRRSSTAVPGFRYVSVTDSSDQKTSPGNEQLNKQVDSYKAQVAQLNRAKEDLIAEVIFLRKEISVTIGKRRRSPVRRGTIGY